jgi:hypothetical protein
VAGSIPRAPAADGADLTSWALQAGGSFAPRKLTVHGNAYYGRGARARSSATSRRQGNIRGWGGWAQAGYDFTPRWSCGCFYGGDLPDVAASSATMACGWHAS